MALTASNMRKAPLSRLHDRARNVRCDTAFALISI
jgi:hypothetical protein